MIPATSVFIDGDEMLGFILYGLWAGSSMSLDASGMPGYEAPGAAVQQFELVGEGWRIRGLDVGFEDAGRYWAAVGELDRALDAILANGGEIAWVGSEGLPFADPPDLFTAEWMEGGVLAARSADGLSFSGISSAGFAPLTNAQLGALERVARAAYESETDGQP